MRSGPSWGVATERCTPIQTKPNAIDRAETAEKRDQGTGTLGSPPIGEDGVNLKIFDSPRDHGYSKDATRDHGNSQDPPRDHGNIQEPPRNHGNSKDAPCDHGNNDDAPCAHGDSMDALPELGNGHTNEESPVPLLSQKQLPEPSTSLTRSSSVPACVHHIHHHYYHHASLGLRPRSTSHESLFSTTEQCMDDFHAGDDRIQQEHDLLEDEYLGNSGSHRGFVVIISVHTFPDKHRNRRGTEHDVQKLERLFESFAFQPRVIHDPTSKDITRHLYELSQMRALEEHDSLVVVLLSHGSQGTLEGTDGSSVPLDDLFDMFSCRRCPMLKGKPKLFIVQACRGDQNLGVSVPDASPGYFTPTLPPLSDMCILYSTHTNFQSFRHPCHGSWLIDAVEEVFLKYGRYRHLLELLLKENQCVSCRRETSTDRPPLRMHPMFETNMTKQFWLVPKQTRVNI